MSDNEHVKAIRSILDGQWDARLEITGDERQAIMRHSDALAAELAEANARAERLRAATLTLGALANAWRSPYYPDPLGEDAQSEMGLHPTDLDAAPGDTAGER